MKLLVAQRRGEVIITDKVMQGIPNVWWRGRQEFAVEAEAGNDYSGEDFIALVLDRRGEQITITEEGTDILVNGWLALLEESECTEGDEVIS
ncbi:Pfs domain-containing protein [Apiospora arundinis]